MKGYETGDTIRVTYEGKADSLGMVWGGNNTGWVGVTEDATVEVIEPVDDPSKDPVGTVRRSPEGEIAIRRSNVWSVPWMLLGVVSGSRGIANHDHLNGWEKLAPVEGTPAAKAAEPKVRYFRADNHAWLNRRVLEDGTIQRSSNGGDWWPSTAWSLSELESRPDIWTEVGSLD